jgi:replication factor A1
MEIDDHAEELASALGVDKEEVKSDLENLLQYSVPIDEAKQSVRRKHGGGGESSATPESLDVADVTTEHSNVTVSVRVLTVGTRSIRYQGEEQVIREGELADETGKISYTAWQDFGFEPGDSVTIGNAGVREWEGDPELNVGANSTVAMEAEPVETPYDGEIGGDADLVDLEPGDRGRNVDARVLEVEERTIDGRDGETTILSGVLADGSARLPFTDWDPHDAIYEGADVRLEDVYVREFRGVPSINVSEFTAVAPLDAPIEVRESAPRLRVGEAVDTGGMYDVELVGNVLAVRDGSGLIERCPECGRVIQNGQCRVHGDVDGEDDLRVKAILDDGTGTVTVVLDDELTAEVYGGGLDEAREAAREAMDKEVVADAIREKLVGRAFRVRGNLSVDDFGANLDADEFEPAEDDPADRAATVLAGLRGGVAADGGAIPDADAVAGLRTADGDAATGDAAPDADAADEGVGR